MGLVCAFCQDDRPFRAGSGRSALASSSRLGAASRLSALGRHDHSCCAQRKSALLSSSRPKTHCRAATNVLKGLYAVFAALSSCGCWSKGALLCRGSSRSHVMLCFVRSDQGCGARTPASGLSDVPGCRRLSRCSHAVCNGTNRERMVACDTSCEIGDGRMATDESHL